MHRIVPVFLVAWLSFLQAEAQKRYALEVVSSDGQAVVDGIIKNKPEKTDSLQCLVLARQAVADLQALGYLTAGADSVRFHGDSCSVYLFTGTQLTWIRLGRGNVDESLLKGSRFRERNFQDRTWNVEEFNRITQKILENCENNGYPFASVRLDSVTLTDSSVTGVLYLERNRFVKIDSVTVRNKQVIAPVYLYNYLGIKPGDPYNESLVRKIGTRFQEDSRSS